MSNRLEHPVEGCLFRAMSSPEEISLKNQRIVLIKSYTTQHYDCVKILLKFVILFY